MTDLVERVGVLLSQSIAAGGRIWPEIANKYNAEARDVIAAVLDDMVGNLEGDFPRMEESTVDLNHYGAVKTWLTAKRKGLGL